MKEPATKQPEPTEDRLGFGRVELWLFSGLLLLVIIRFFGAFSLNEMPNWDAPGHYFALVKMAEYLQNGHISGYLHEWLGGMELFRFYPPLYYAITAGLWLATFRLVPLVLIFRLSALLAVFSSAISLWLFVRTFIGRAAARWSIVLAAAFIFYPIIFSMVGIGGGAALWVGLIPNAFGLSLVFVWLSLMERLRQRPEADGRLVLVALAGAALALTHTLSFIFGGLLFGIWLTVQLVRRRPVRRPLCSVGISFGLIMFWLLPFLGGLYLTSGSERGETSNLIYLLSIFPLNVPYLEFGVIAVALLSLGGTFFLFKQKRWTVLCLWLGAIAFFLLRWPISRILPSLGIHYYRFLAFIYFLQLAVAAPALDWLWRQWADGVRRRQGYLIVLAGLVAISYFSAFDVFDRASQEPDSFRRPLSWSWDDFRSTEEGKRVVDRLAKLEDVNRVYLEMPLAEALSDFGSHFYYAVRLPLDNRQAVAGGLFVESAPLTPFMVSSLKTIQSGYNPIWGDERLRLVQPFVKQGTGLQLARLAHLGISHLVAYGPETADRLSKATSIESVDKVDDFQIFALPQAKPSVYPSAYRPGVYLSSYGGPSFRDLSLALYAGSSTFDYPVIDSHMSISSLLDQGEIEVSAVIVQADRLTTGEVNSLKLLSAPCLLLNPGEEARLAADGAENIHLIDNFEIIPKGSRQLYTDYPAGWSDLWQAVGQLKEGAEIPNVDFEVMEYNNERIVFRGSGPVIVNSGYSARWQAEGGEVVWRVSPELMLVWADPEQATTLRYRKEPVDYIGMAISGLTLVLMVVWWGRRRRKD